MNKHIQLIVKLTLLFVLPLFLLSCNSEEENKNEAQVYLNQYYIDAYGESVNVEVISVSPCELSKNQKAEGTSDRWVVQYTIDDRFFGGREERTSTISKSNGRWFFF